MWEAMCRPLLPQLAKSFAARLKAEIEKATRCLLSQEAVVTDAPSTFAMQDSTGRQPTRA